MLRRVVWALGRAAPEGAGPAAVLRHSSSSAASFVSSVQDLSERLENESGLTRVGNKHLAAAAAHATGDDLNEFRKLIALYVYRNKKVNSGVADDIVRRYISENQPDVVADMVSEKLTYGLFPSADVYLELMRALSDGGYSRAIVSMFERLILEKGPLEPPTECFEMLAVAAEDSGNVGADNTTRVADYCVAARTDGLTVGDGMLQRVARGCIDASAYGAAEAVEALAAAAGASGKIWEQLRVEAISIEARRAAEGDDAAAALAAVQRMEAVSDSWGEQAPLDVLAAIAELTSDVADDEADTSLESQKLGAILDSLREAGVDWEVSGDDASGDAS